MGAIGMLIIGMIGAGIMYLLDPDMGRRRRALLRDQMTKAQHKIGDAADAASEQIHDRAQGAVASTGSSMEHEPVSDVTLVARVRAELGRATQHAGAIDVVANSGMITLRGSVLKDDLMRVISTANNVMGVKNVINQMTVYDTPEGIPSLQGSSAPPRTGTPGLR